ncbi:MAG: hypothetical protein DME07_03965 [Candidatus Rokuibacteriota bacterium]|nr:MAG: hypothetical protein DME07_03965 [Candidatus Rokubacteria bacterium]
MIGSIDSATWIPPLGQCTRAPRPEPWRCYHRASWPLPDEVKSIITVVAKTHRYWPAHVTGSGRGVGAAERG